MARLGPRDEVRDHGGDLGRTEIARQDHFARVERAALLDPEQEIGDQRRIEHPAADGRVTRPVAQQRGRHRDHVDAVHLHRKHRGAVADMAEGDLRLDGDDGHAVGRSNIRCLCAAAGTTRGYQPKCRSITRWSIACPGSRLAPPPCPNRMESHALMICGTALLQCSDELLQCSKRES